MNFKSREKLLASVAALSLLGISPQQTFAAQITTNQAVQQTKKITGNRIRCNGSYHRCNSKSERHKKCRSDRL